MLLTAAMLFHLFFQNIGFTIWPALAETRSNLQNPPVIRESTYFVAENGSDNGPGTRDLPWATINHAAERVEAGDTVVVRGGRYVLSAQVRPRKSGRSEAWITFIGYPGETPVLDAELLPRSLLVQGGLDNGAFQIEGVSYVRVENLTVVNSHDAGITVRDSSYIDVINDSTKETFSSGIAVWDTKHDGRASKHIRILGNTITKATSWELAPSDAPRSGEPPHEAISIGGAVDFEVAYNHVYDSGKEGMDIKETSKQGKVHHNFVHNLERQGIYVDAWFGQISDIEIFSNVIRNCRGAGLVLSVENGHAVEHVNIHHNLIFNNEGSGLYFSRWGVDNPRRQIRINNNIFYHNGYGPPAAGQTYYWLTGGLYLYSTNVLDISITDNIFSENRGFQIGYSELFSKDRSWREIAREKNILIANNVIDGRNAINLPIESGGYPADRVKIFAVNGDRAIFGDPLFKKPAEEDFTLRRGSPAAAGHVAAGPYALGSPIKLWWKHDFRPKLFQTHLDRFGW
jgi:Right handed beta helix region